MDKREAHLKLFSLPQKFNSWTGCLTAASWSGACEPAQDIGNWKRAANLFVSEAEERILAWESPECVGAVLIRAPERGGQLQSARE